MDFSIEELKEIWARSDEYFQFSYDEYSSFGSRLRKWRELNNLSQQDMGEAIYEYRKYLGLENDDISNESIEIAYDGPEELRPFDFEIEAKRAQKRERRITSLSRSYAQWESKETDSSFADTRFSMTNLYILKKLIGCDYEFLFCEINTPHRDTTDLIAELGLNISTIEKLISIDKSYMENTDGTESSYYSYCILDAINKIISDDDLLVYLSWYITNPENYECDSSLNSTTIEIHRPADGIPTEDAYIDGDIDTLRLEDILLVYITTIANKLESLRSTTPHRVLKRDIDLPSLDNITLAQSEDSFGTRLRNWRDYNHYTQEHVADLIYNFRQTHNLKKIVKGTPQVTDKRWILRTYQNWESKTAINDDTLLSMIDLFILKNIMGCDYEYLFGEINTLNRPKLDTIQITGLTAETIQRLEGYAERSHDITSVVSAYSGKILETIDLIVSDNKLLSNLAYYFSDLPFQIDMRYCSILKPIQIVGFPSLQSDVDIDDAYSEYLFPEGKELRNVFLPTIMDCLKTIRKRYLDSTQISRKKASITVDQIIKSK